MQTAINPGLAQVLGAMDVISPVTPEGTPTVAAKVMQAAQQAMSPQVAMPQVAQQAGLGGQIQAMQMQEAQKAMMQDAMQKQQQPQMPQGSPGIEGLNPQMGNFAEGGIVGYAGGGGAKESMNPLTALLRKLAELELPTRAGSGVPQDEIATETARAMQAPVAEIPIPEIVIEEKAAAPGAAPTRAPAPAAPAATGGGGGIESLFERERAGYRAMKGPATLDQSIQRAQQNKALLEAAYRAEGIDPNYIDRRLEEDKALMEQQRGLLRERMEREQGRDTFLSRAGAALRGFSQMKGQGIGGGMVAAHENLARQVQSGEIRMDQMRDFELKLNELDVNRRRALEDAKRATVEGRVKDAKQELNNATEFSNEIEKMVASTFGKQAAQMVEQQKAREAGAARMADQQRIQELYQLRLNTLTQGKPPTDEQKMQAMEYALQTVRGAGGAARAQTAADALALKRQELASKVPAYNLAQMTAFSTSPSITEEKRQKAREVMAQIEAQYGISGGPAPTGGSEGFKLLSVQPSPR